MNNNDNNTTHGCRVGKTFEDETDVYIGRGKNGDVHINNSEVGEYGWLGNPYSVSEYGREESIARFARAFLNRIEEDREFRQAVAELDGKALGCFCQELAEDGPACHGEVISQVVELLHQ